MLRRACGVVSYVASDAVAPTDVQDGDTDWGLGVVLSFQKRGATQDVSMSREAGGARFVVDMLLRCKPRRSKREAPQPADPSDKDAQLQVVSRAAGWVGCCGRGGEVRSSQPCAVTRADHDAPSAFVAVRFR